MNNVLKIYYNQIIEIFKVLEDNVQTFQSKTVKVRSAQNTSKIMWLYGFKKTIFKTASTIRWNNKEIWLGMYLARRQAAFQIVLSWI